MDIEWKDGKLTKATIKSITDIAVTVMSAEKSKIIRLKKGVPTAVMF